MTTGYVSRWRTAKERDTIITILKEMMQLNYHSEITPKVEWILMENTRLNKENLCLKKDLISIKSEFNKKKIGNLRVIADKRKYKCWQKGILYFNKINIGKKVIVWQK